jgi:hypothetical protein
MLPACTEVLPAETEVLPADFVLADFNFQTDVVSADKFVGLLPTCTEVLHTTAEKVLCSTEVLPAEKVLRTTEVLQCRPL